MHKINGGTVTLLVSLAVGVVGVSAQEPAEDEGRVGLRRGTSAEMIMSMRKRLELTEAQLSALDEIRRETVQRRSAEMADMAEMRSRLRAGQIRRSEMMAFIEDRQEANQGLAEQRRARVEAVLSEAQIEALRSMRRGGRDGLRRGGRDGLRGGGRDGLRRGGRDGLWRGGRESLRRGGPEGLRRGGPAYYGRRFQPLP